MAGCVRFSECSAQSQWDLFLKAESQDLLIPRCAPEFREWGHSVVPFTDHHREGVLIISCLLHDIPAAPCSCRELNLAPELFRGRDCHSEWFTREENQDWKQCGLYLPFLTGLDFVRKMISHLTGGPFFATNSPSLEFNFEPCREPQSKAMIY